METRTGSKPGLIASFAKDCWFFPLIVEKAYIWLYYQHKSFSFDWIILELAEKVYIDEVLDEFENWPDVSCTTNRSPWLFYFIQTTCLVHILCTAWHTKWAGTRHFLQDCMCAQRELRTQMCRLIRVFAVISLICSPEDALDHWQPTECPVKTLIRLCWVFASRTYNLVEKVVPWLQFIVLIDHLCYRRYKRVLQKVLSLIGFFSFIPGIF